MKMVILSACLVSWMALCPILKARRAPAKLLNWVSKKIGLTKWLKLTVLLGLFALGFFVAEMSALKHATQQYHDCQEGGRSVDNCSETRGIKWRAERNAWMMTFNVFLWGMVHIMSAQVKREEELTQFLQDNQLTEAFGRFEDELKRTGSHPIKQQ